MMKRKNKTSLLKKTVQILPLLIGCVPLVYVGLLIRDMEIPTVLPVDDVRVIGQLDFLDEKNIESIVKSEIDGGYFTVDMNNIRSVLMQQPWVKKVSLRRQWPANLDVVITEQVPVAYWNNDGYINEYGEVFKPQDMDTELNLPILNGPDGHHSNVWKFMNVLYQEMALLEFEVVRLDLDERRSWQLVIAGYKDLDDSEAEANPIDVKLGRFETEKRLKRFVRILPSLMVGNGSVNTAMIENRIKVIDMRYPNGFAVQLAATQVSDKQESGA